MLQRPSHLSSIHETLRDGILDLVTSAEPPRTRLTAFVRTRLQKVPVAAFDDAGARAWLERLLHRMTSVTPRDERSPVSATVAEMSDEEIDDTLIEIVAFYEEVTRLDTHHAIRRRIEA
ncbi:MAG: hypothetical protein KDJ41_11430 [Hyphomicrobiaceae bacterium]|nr:hypothetical protein [Hyphomicrobiaceae bacterium]